MSQEADSSSFYADKQHAQLLKTFTILSVLAIALILLLASYGLYSIIDRYIIQDAEKDAVNVGQAIFEQESAHMLTTDVEGKKRLFVDPERFPVIDQQMQKYLHPLQMVKIKVFSLDKEIVYSTDHSIIGTKDQGNTKLDDVFKGEVLSTLEKKDEVWDLVGEQRFDVDIVETYLPIREQNNTVIGAFEVYADVSRDRQEIQTVLLSSVGMLATVLLGVFGMLFLLMRRVSLQLATAQKELEKMAVMDGLTGIFNRRYLLLRAEEEFAKVRRFRNRIVSDTISFIMIDIDHFKQINDTYGHLIGDEILREVSHRLKQSLRKYDIVGRYGGEEFLVMLPNTDFPEAKSAAERLWKVVREAPIITSGRPHHITISLGLAYTQEADTNMQGVLKRADEALYKAKKNGRDTIAWL